MFSSLVDATATPNFLAVLLLALWPFVTFALFAACSPQVACVWSFLGAEMILPSNIVIDLAYLPRLDKDTIASTAALAAALIFHRALLMRKSAFRWNDLLLGVIVLGALFTTLTNREPLKIGPLVMPGQTVHDFASDTLLLILQVWPPLLLGRNLFTSSQDVRVLLQSLIIGGLIYSLLVFVEIHWGPNLNLWAYGYHQSDLNQTVRFGGYRPKVFMRHGLNVAFFLLMAVLSAASLMRARIKLHGVTMGPALAYLFVVLILCKSAGAILYAAFALVPLLLCRTKVQAALAFALVSFVLAYPSLRGFDLVPVDQILAFIRSTLGNDRAASMQFRFANERLLLEHALMKPWFGWGGYGRNFLFDPVTGIRTTTVDGYWIAVLGYGGAAAFIGIFGMLLLPVAQFAKKLLMAAEDEWSLGGGVLLMSSIYVLDLVPNAGVAGYMTLMLGVLAGIKLKHAEIARLPVKTEEWSASRLDKAAVASFFTREL